MNALIKTGVTVILSGIALSATAATVTLDPSTTAVGPNGQFTVDLVMDASDAPGNKPGFFQGIVELGFDNAIVQYDDFQFVAPSIALGVSPIVTATTINVAFNGAEAVGTIGTFTFTAIGAEGSTIDLSLIDPSFLGSFVNTDPTIAPFTPDITGTSLSIVPIPAAALLFGSALGFLGFSTRRKAS